MTISRKEFLKLVGVIPLVGVVAKLPVLEEKPQSPATVPNRTGVLPREKLAEWELGSVQVR